MIIPQSNVTTHFSRPSFYKAPVLRFELAGEDTLTKKIECVTAMSFRGFYRRLKKEDHTSLTLIRKGGFFKSRKVKVLVKNKDLKELIGKAEFKELQTIDSSGKRFSQLKKCVSLKTLNAIKPSSKKKAGDWSSLFSKVNNQLESQFSNIGNGNLKKVRQAINKMIVSKKKSIFALVEIKIDGKIQQIFLKKRKGQLLTEHAKLCGEGADAMVYKAACYALKKFKLATSLALAESNGNTSEELKDIEQDLEKEITEEIKAGRDVSNITGTLKIFAKLKDMGSDRLIGYVMKAYDGDFGDYLLSNSLNSPHRAMQLCQHFIKLADTFAGMHKIDKVHTDIKIDNIFTNFDQNGISELVIGDITKTDPEYTTFSYSLPYCFQSDVLKIKRNTQDLTLLKRLELQKKLDVRQCAFFMYYSIRAERSTTEEIEGKVKLNGAFPLNDPSYAIDSPKDYTNKKEREANYTPIPKGKAPRALRDYIKHLLTEDFDKLPSMEEVHQKLKKISLQTFKTR